MSMADKCVICNVNFLTTEQEIAIRCCTRCQTKPKKTEPKKVETVVRTASEMNQVVEELAAQLNEVCQCEARIQGQGHSIKDYKDASESVKGFNRALAMFILKREAEAKVERMKDKQPAKPVENRPPKDPSEYFYTLRNGERVVNGKLERDTETGKKWVYVHGWNCEGGCEYSCNPLHPFNAKKGI